MKRYRILLFDFDTRINVLVKLEEICHSNPTLQLQHQIDQITFELRIYYGEKGFEQKLQNLKEIGGKQFSIIAYHNVLLGQIRESFINGYYYPALTAACALGERILNHLVLDLRELYNNTDDYEKVKDKKSFSNWDMMIKTLTSWNILLPNVIEKFETLKTLRHKSIHFNQNLINDLRAYSLQSITLIQKILFEQFSAFGNQPWFITSIPGEIYLKKEWENNPFIAKYYIPNSALVGHKHKILNVMPLSIEDLVDYGDEVISDEKFSNFRRNQN